MLRSHHHHHHLHAFVKLSLVGCLLHEWIYSWVWLVRCRVGRKLWLQVWYCICSYVEGGGGVWQDWCSLGCQCYIVGGCFDVSVECPASIFRVTGSGSHGY